MQTKSQTIDRSWPKPRKNPPFIGIIQKMYKSAPKIASHAQ